ncbi:hypothetical protein HLVA_22440 (plasmid) [Haliovirga abyssi]|uniref:Pre-toxin TG domain-containing protein n=2 Tax=Haliovirga abyssi TaxID=2996794 RepID=A0AAU9E563_9FUSO|nr:hypothetical protein HLVA_22440 [Haliovirga abyssi]
MMGQHYLNTVTAGFKMLVENLPWVESYNDSKTASTGKDMWGEPTDRAFGVAGLALPLAGSTLKKVGNIIKKLDPSLIRFSQNSIKNTFKNGGKIEDLIAGLKNGSINPDDIPAIRVFEKDGKIYSLDNRRLKAFKDAGLDINVKRVNTNDLKIEREIKRKFKPINDGLDIKVRGE